MFWLNLSNYQWDVTYEDYPDRTQLLASVFTFSGNYFEYCHVLWYESYRNVLWSNRNITVKKEPKREHCVPVGKLASCSLFTTDFSRSAFSCFLPSKLPIDSNWPLIQMRKNWELNGRNVKRSNRGWIRLRDKQTQISCLQGGSPQKSQCIQIMTKTQINMDYKM